MMLAVSAGRGVGVVCTPTWFTTDVASYVDSRGSEVAPPPPPPFHLRIAPLVWAKEIFQRPRVARCAFLRGPSPSLNHAPTSRREPRESWTSHSHYGLFINRRAGPAGPRRCLNYTRRWIWHLGAGASSRLLIYIFIVRSFFFPLRIS